MPSLGNATLLELAVVAVALFGLGMSLRTIHAYVLDWQDVRSTGKDGYRRRWTNQHLRTEVLRSSMLALFLILGTLACFIPPASHEENRTLGIVASIFFVCMEAALAYQAWADYRDNRANRALAEAEDRAWQRPGHDL